MMNKKTVSRLCARILSFILVFLIYVSIFPVPVSTKAANTSSDRVIVGLGDSFSSGEGIEEFYDQNLPIEQKINSQDWLAHRSTKAWSGKLTLNDNDSGICYIMNLSKYDENKSDKEAHWYFVASSGAETVHLDSKQPQEYHLEINGKICEDSGYITNQLAIFETVEKNNQKADYVTLTLGGNDLGFKEIIETAAMDFTFTEPEKLNSRLAEKVNQLNTTTAGNLESAYKKISDTAGKQANIIVAGYPKLFSSSKLHVNALFSYEERTAINNAIVLFNEKLAAIVKNCQTNGYPVHFVPVADEFKDHEAYTPDAYINRVYLFPNAQDLKQIGKFPISSAYSIHPNEKGAEAYARCVQAKIDELEKEKNPDYIPPNTSPPQTTMIFTQPPPLTSPQPTKSWDSAAIDLLCNAPDYGFEINDVNIGYELIDVTGDNIPEIFFCTGLGATCIPAISGYFYYNGSRYVKGTVSGNNGYFPILPFQNGGKTIYLTNHLAPEDLPEEIPGYASYWYKDVTVCQLNCSGSNANFTTVADYSEYGYQIEKLYYSGEEDKIAQAEELWKSYCNEIENFHYRYPPDEYQNYVLQNFVTLDTCSAEAYKAAFTRFDIEEAVFHYVSYC
ncbi:MAG: hypothetical protein J6D06_00085 [Clostridia bacterium]|nr:hypothetical protein [Clostridia bacterium]